MVVTLVIQVVEIIRDVDVIQDAVTIQAVAITRDVAAIQAVDAIPVVETAQAANATVETEHFAQDLTKAIMLDSRTDSKQVWQITTTVQCLFAVV